MSAPYHLTPRVPAAPHPTPHSASAYIQPNSKLSKPPIHNPYDKFTQPEFDAWIGGITSALRRALGDEEEPKLQATASGTDVIRPRYGWGFPAESEDEAADDSFAEIKARRAAGKGKARDPREGPGLGKGDHAQPIEIPSSDEEEEEEVELSITVDESAEEDSEEEQEVAEYSDGEQEEEEGSWEWEGGQSSSQLLRPLARKRVQGSRDEEYDEDYDEYDEESYEDQDEEETEEIGQRNGITSSPIVIISDDEENEEKNMSAEHSLKDDEAISGDEGDFSIGSNGEEDKQIDPSRTSNSSRSQISVSSVEGDEEEDMLDEDDEIQEIQPAEDDTSFPPQAHLSPEQLLRHLEIPDPWSGPRTYAEDFYSGGDVVLLPGQKVDPSRLGPIDEDFNEELSSRQAEDMEDVDEIQPPQADTSFPQHDEEEERPIEIPNPWEAPQTYAEDFYSGGDIRALPGQPIDPSLLLGTGDLVDDIDSFLTPEVLSRSHSNERTLLYNREDEEQEDEQYIQLPSQHYVSSFHGDRLVSADVELITIDDSDEEEGATQVVGNRPSPQSELDELQHPEKDELCDFPREEGSDVIGPSSVAQEALFEQASQPLEGLQVPSSDRTQEHDEVISNLVNWNNPPAFPTGKPASASGHLATPSPEQNEEIFVSVVDETTPPSVDEDRCQIQDSEVVDPETTGEIPDDYRETSPFEMVAESQAGIIASGGGPSILRLDDVERELEDATVPSQGVHNETNLEAEGTTYINAPFLVSEQNIQETELAAAGEDAPIEFPPVADSLATSIVDELMVNDDGIRSSPPSGDDNGQESQHQPLTSPSQVQFNLPDVYGQLPTPPSEKGRHVELPQMEREDPTSHHSPQEKHKVEIEEIPDEDDYCPQPAEPSVDMDFGVHVQKTLEYTVVEPVDVTDGGSADEDADGEVDEDVEIVSVKSGDERREDAQYLVEEAVTEGRLTEEPADRAMSLGVISVGPEEVEAFRQSRQEDENIGQEAPVAEDMTEEITSKGEGILEEEATTGAEVASTDEEKEQQGTELTLPRQSHQEDEDVRQEAVISEDVGDVDEIMGKGEGVLEEEIVTHSEVASTYEEQEQQELAPSPAHVEPLRPQRDTITANADVPNPIDRSQTPPPYLNLNLGTLDVIASPVSAPHSPGEPIADYIAIPQSVVRSLGEGVIHPFSSGGTAQPKLFTHSPSVEPPDKAPDSATLVPEEIQSNVISGDLPQRDLQSEHAEHLQSTPANKQTNAGGDLSEYPTTTSQPSATFKGMLLTRKPSIPILMADPYPYCLSTPESSMYPDQDEASEEEIGLDNSLSSNSTLEKEVEAARHEANILDDLDDLDFQYPPESEIQTRFANGVQTLPDVGSSDATFPGVGSLDIFPDLLKKNDTQTITIPPVHGKESDVGGNGDASSTELGDLPSDVVGIDNVALPAGLTEKEEGTLVVKQAEDHNPHQPSQEPSPDAESSQRASKRKRDSSPAAPADIPSARSTTSFQKGKGKKSAKSDRKSRVESKLDALEVTVEDTIRVKPRPQGKLLESLQRERALEGSASQSSSGTNMANRVLQPGSRASSIASSAPSDKSFNSQPSPTINKPTAPPPAPFIPPTSLFHAHGQKRKLMAKLIQSQSQRPKLSRTPSLKHNIEEPPVPRSSLSPVITSPPVLPPAISPVIPTPVVSHAHIESPSQILTLPPPPNSDVVQVSQPPAPILNPPAPIVIPKATKSPAKVVPASTPLVTRSHCRYRRISLPKEEGGPRICFLVPGCSLNDRELMDEEEIEDHGDARNEDASRIIRDIENLAFDSNLIGVLRQLVGLDILREQEVFYLPQPGEEVVRKMPNPPRKERSSKAKASGESPGLASSPGYSGSIRSPASIRPPVSAADSTSTSRSVLRNLLDLESERGSMVGDTNSELDPNDYEGGPRLKRAKPSPPDGQKAMGPPRTQSKGKAKAKAKGSNDDDDIFKPDDSELDHSPDGKPVRKPRKSATKRGLKRTRTEVIAEEGNERRPKKLRLQFTAPAALPESPAKPAN